MSCRYPGRLVPVVLCLLMLAGLTAPAASAQTPAASPVSAIEPAFTEEECTRDMPKGLTEGEDVVCGYVTAPMYPGTDRPETVELSVVKLTATTDDPTPEPLLILNGGPGQSLDAVFPLFGEDAPFYDYMRERQDVILFDQRGMGLSQPSLACPFEHMTVTDATPEPIATPDSTPVAMPETTAGFDEDIETLLDECGTALADQGIDFSAFTTTQNAADIDAIRLALGVDQVDLYGISYGSKLALVTIRDFPDSIRSTIIASPLPLEDDVFSQQVTGFDAALRTVFEGCAADDQCNAANPDLEATFLSTVEKLRAEPMVVELTDPISGSTIDLPIDAPMYMQVAYLSVFVGDLVPMLPLLITSVDAGDSSILQNIMQVMLMASGGSSMGAMVTFFCQEEYPFEPRETYDQAIADAGVLPPLSDGTFVGVGDMIFATCDTWDLGSVDPIENEPFVSDEPVLILTGTFDPITPPENGEQVAANLPNSTLVEFHSQGHDPATVAIGCSPAIITSFLDDPAAEIDTSCAEIPMDFSPDWLYEGDLSAGPVASPQTMPAN